MLFTTVKRVVIKIDTTSQQEDQQQSEAKTSVVVAGDSMIKYVKGWELSTGQQNVSVKSFSGATVDDMTDFLKPTSRKHPDKLIIHVGTNDLRKSDPKTVAHKVINLAKQFKKDSNDTKIVISSLVVRNDGPALAKKVKQTNILLKSNCIINDIALLDNHNINCTHLNYRGLHLNRDGSALLQNNIANILKSKDGIEERPRKKVSETWLNIQKTRGFKMAMLNIASLPKHFDEISLMLHDKKIDILALNETHLDPSISDELVSVDGYDLIRADRIEMGEVFSCTLGAT